MTERRQGVFQRADGRQALSQRRLERLLPREVVEHGREVDQPLQAIHARSALDHNDVLRFETLAPCRRLAKGHRIEAVQDAGKQPARGFASASENPRPRQVDVSWFLRALGIHTVAEPAPSPGDDAPLEHRHRDPVVQRVPRQEQAAHLVSPTLRGLKGT